MICIIPYKYSDRAKVVGGATTLDRRLARNIGHVFLLEYVPHSSTPESGSTSVSHLIQILD